MSIICAIFTTLLYDEESCVLKLYMWMSDKQKKGTTLQRGP